VCTKYIWDKILTRPLVSTVSVYWQSPESRIRGTSQNVTH
jgi:hypothetical protein